MSTVICIAEELSHLTNGDRKHPLHFEEFEDNLLNSLPYLNIEYSKIITAKMFYYFLDFVNYYSEKYYGAGFENCLNLLIMSLEEMK